MPRGNDPSAATELEEQYGPVVGNAEAVIKANRERYPKELLDAQYKKVDEEATEALDYGDVAKAAGVDSVQSATVRGASVVYVYEDENGRQLKKALPYRDGKVQAKEQKETAREGKK